VRALRLRGYQRIFVICLVLVFWGEGCTPRVNKTPVKVFIAASLVVPFAELEKAYEQQHPEVDVQVEAHGSIQVVRHVTEIHDEIDVVVPADYILIPMLMYPTTVPETGEPYADWTIQWSGNRLVIAHTPDSAYADEISPQNWYEVISRSDVLFGLADPRFDAAGYRTLMVGALAEGYYDDPTIFEKLFLGQFTQPIMVKKESGVQVIHVPELLETSENANIVMRGGSVALLALLESGDVDYAFEYESVARQHGLEYVELPPELHLGDPDLADYYATVRVDLDYQRFASVTPSFPGDTITYGLTIPSNAPHPTQAKDFVAFMLGPEGSAIMEASQHPIFPTPQVDNPPALPDSLKALFP
jgi:molybdate/tungstate transport system substrate-binding protein